MPKHYEALQRAEEERRRKAAGDASKVPASVPFEGVSASPVPARQDAKKAGLLSKVIRREKGAPSDMPSDVNKRRIALLQPESYVAEQYRSLRGRIDALAAQRPLKTVAVTSASAAPGSRARSAASRRPRIDLASASSSTSRSDTKPSFRSS